MAKSKKRLIPDKVNKPRPKNDVKKNPFEVKLNRQKHEVINRKFKSERGLPGVARDRAISKRKATLLKEYVQRNKDTVLLDRRIGEGDADLDPDEKMARRLARESARKNRKNLFNLNDDEVLTHLGQSIEEARAEDDPRSDDEDLYDKLDAAFVNKAHFGGFLRKAEGTEETRKRAIDELIAESKRLKRERQIEVDENIKLTEELDSKWRAVSSLVAQHRGAAGGDAGKPSKRKDSAPDSFDLLVSELQSAPRIGAASDRTRNAEEIAKAERERLEELERQRLARARGEDLAVKIKTVKHRSADDLDDGFEAQGQSGEDDEDKESGESNDESDQADDEDKEDSDASADDSDGEDSNEEDEDASDSYDDLKSDSDNEAGEEAQVKQKRVKGGILKRTSDAPKAKAEKSPKSNPPSEPLTQDIPYLIGVPENMDDYEELVRGRSPAEELIIVQRVISGNAPSLHEHNKRRLEAFLRLLLDRVFIVLEEATLNEEGRLKPGVLELVDGLVVPIHQLTEISPFAAAKSFVEIVRNIYQGERSRGPKKDSGFPGCDRLIMFKLISICFSTSDKKHVVATPALICMAHMLTACKVTDGRNMVRGLFVAQLMLEYVAFGGKYVPEVVAFILRLLNESQRLTLLKPVEDQDLRLRLSDLYCSPDLELPRIIRCKVLFALLHVIDLAADVFVKVSSFPEVFAPIVQRLGKLESSFFPERLKTLLASVVTKLSRPRKREPLRRERKRPQMLKLYEPLIEERVDLLRKIHKEKGKGARAETRKLQAKYKKELKSAMREVRRDNQFIAHHKLKEQLKLDADRKVKVKKLFGELANQQGELNSLQKLKAKKK